MKWNLDSIYGGFSSDKFKSDLLFLKKSIERFKRFKGISLKCKKDDEIISILENIFSEYDEIYILFTKLSSFVFLNMACDSNNKEAMDNDCVLKNIYVDVALIDFIITKVLSTSDNVLSILNKSDMLVEYSFLIRELIDNSKYLLSDEVEETMVSLLNYGAISYSTLQDTLISKYKVELNIDGCIREIPLTECRAMLENSNRSLRFEALKAEKKLYRYMEDPISFALNNIKKSVIYDNKKRGYDSPLSKSLRDNRISEKTFDSLISVMRESLPLFRDFLKLKGRIIGDKHNKIYYSDLFVQTLESKNKIDFSYARDFLIRNFYDFSTRVGDFVKNAFDNNWIDSDIYEGKVGGAFCSNINSIKESRILLNFNNSYDSIFTLAHELGHAYHGELIKNERILNTDYPMTIAETASIFFETLICDKAFNSVDEREKIIILEYELNSATQVIVDIYSRFLFERDVFERCENEFLTSDNLNSIMLNAQKEAYGDSMHHEYFKEAWIYKSHYYDFNYNFYNYPYAFGLLFSLGIYDCYLNNSNDFHVKYEELLSKSGKNNLEDLGEIFNIDVSDKDFFRRSIEILKNKYYKYKDLVL
ncbi:pepF/M3 family oligoendopeptidase [Candidatus Arthromitus sp. SFB-mouse-Japan]|uniref:M3 family oligoendopeptidase n=1 Tax=unclassified Candidatus Neoarthromitus TaxID=2638829 RepID=UPI00021B810D|nr:MULTISPECIES: M3 family oligoendopeptidase [unclassified Candidatus Arthromitus]EIA24868.1 Oligoendopeptidase, pepF/M3 family [Candidatus Arthromitus sp. SFB-1]EIA24967.1 Oligoendopeptidase, pepF/M3 family [Candidatus Arthromitus sp. SFB-2]EIA28205.1 Oligoendopeptidase, pepF/M3 family [Candidatus Arthromitus sp. SFB-co]EIA30104.1 Oligoendopeptidase, pepF/M3 family [Candidatus Arthromitus sp. SFB-mouse-SU]AID45297.1 Oligoendopeptidase F [Candidatus Arthromitus sp. SFB-mouse-NL]